MAGAVSNVNFDARSLGLEQPVHRVSLDGRADGYDDAPPGAVNPETHPAGKPAQANPPANPVNNDGLRAQQVVRVRLPSTSNNAVDGFETFYLSTARVHSDGSEERLDSEFEYAQLLQVAARVEALALQGLLCGTRDFSNINTIKLNLHRANRLHEFTLQKVRFTPNGGALQEMRPDLYANFVARMQQEISNLGQTLAKVDNDRREECEQRRKHGEHPSQKSI